MENMIEITGVDLVKFVQATYALSSPQGMGFLHFQEGGLPEDEAREIIERESPKGRVAASMDYVRGRACKMVVFRAGDRLFIRPTWFDHSDSQLRELLEKFGIKQAA